MITVRGKAYSSDKQFETLANVNHSLELHQNLQETHVFLCAKQAENVFFPKIVQLQH